MFGLGRLSCSGLLPARGRRLWVWRTRSGISAGKSADFVLVRPPAGSTLAAVLGRSESMEEPLGAVFTLAREESIAEVRVAGEVVWP